MSSEEKEQGFDIEIIGCVQMLDKSSGNNENTASNNNVEILDKNVQRKPETCKSRKRKRYLSQQQQRKNNKNWKLNKSKRQQSENIDIDAIKTTNYNYDKNARKTFFSMIKFNKNQIRCRQRTFPILSKFFLPEKRPRKDLIVPPTKFLLGGNISDPLNLKNIQNELNTATPKSSPITTPPKIEVIIPPNIHDPLHLLDPVDAIEYQKQLISPLKKKKKAKHRNRNKKKKIGNENPNDFGGNTNNNDEKNISTTSSASDEVNSKEISTNVISLEIGDSRAVVGTLNVSERENITRDLRLDLREPSAGRKRKVSESHLNAKVKVRRMDSMDKIVSPVIPQPGAWKRIVNPIPSGAPRNNPRNRTRTISSQSEDISPSDEIKKDNVFSVLNDESEHKINEENIGSSEKHDTSLDANQIDGNIKSVPKFKNSDAKYKYGNYDRYYGYRNLNEFMDVRLKVFMKFPHLFNGKDVLDIGCNAGHITISVAKNLAPKSITGIDIDGSLIAKGRKNLALYVKMPPLSTINSFPKPSTSSNANKTEDQQKQTQSTTACHKDSEQEVKAAVHNSRVKHQHSNKFQHENDEFFPISFPKCYGTIPESCNSQSPPTVTTFPKNVIFKTCNYVLKDESLLNADTQQYDLILCLSVTKWIHLNHGDAGLKLAFKRMFNQLRPGGKLILEAQNWASYKKKKKLTENIFNHFKTIEFYPNKFHEYLLGPEVGFSHSYPLGIPRHLSKGFRRPIQLYIKGDYTPSQIRWSDNYYPQTPHDAYQGIYAEPIQQSRCPTGNKSLWNTPHGNYSYRFTPSQHFSSTSQYYNPFETDSYLPSYNSEIQKRQYCFASPLYSAIWSPPSGRNSSSHTPFYGSSSRDADTNEEQCKKKHVYPPTEDYEVSKTSNRSAENDLDKSPKNHVYVATDSDHIVTSTAILENTNLQFLSSNQSNINDSKSDNDVLSQD